MQADNQPDEALLTYLRRLPKVDLHCHLIGTVRAQTWQELAAKHAVPLLADPAVVYAAIDSTPPGDEEFADIAVPLLPTEQRPRARPGYPLLEVSRWVADALVDHEDFARISYEAIQDAVTNSNVKHLELHFEAGAFLARGVRYATVVDGLVEGMKAADHDYGTTSLLIAGLDRSQPAAAAAAVVEEMLAHPHDRVVGIGLDNLERAGPPERFAAVYHTAAAGGLRRTAHAGEHVPAARNVLVCVDQLQCERIDHGYFILEDKDAVARCRDRGTWFTCIFTTSRREWRPWRRESIRRMMEAGLNVVFASDDPAMFPTTLTAEYLHAADVLGGDRARLAAHALNGIDAAWLDDSDRRSLRSMFRREIERLNKDHSEATARPE